MSRADTPTAGPASAAMNSAAGFAGAPDEERRAGRQGKRPEAGLAARAFPLGDRLRGRGREGNLADGAASSSPVESIALPSCFGVAERIA